MATQRVPCMRCYTLVSDGTVCEPRHPVMCLTLADYIVLLPLLLDSVSRFPHCFPFVFHCLLPHATSTLTDPGSSCSNLVMISLATVVLVILPGSVICLPAVVVVLILLVHF
jgi:integral membrane sensor domain MASE1